MKPTLPMMLPVGTYLYGYCSGFFGRDSYANKLVEAVGPDWVVARTLGGTTVEFAFIPENRQGPEMFESWKRWP